ncbi:MAG: bifunctional phosphopantothenoylcysteine decarboxylase/phosphopantothenate--cysteine ligase CoaBC [Bacteroidaceae bacterium]|nr:bifunctional phosphopantothenoylcysteine decarboxylase/phosphopantothenate--cysteine ligase CoaBC [Bacteroidaceae bacterium]
MNRLSGKHIVLGISGSIAAYKSCELIRQLVKLGAEVKVVITPSGKEFITPLTLATLSRNPVISEFFSQRDGSWNSHVDLGLWADAMIIAPATASTIGKMVSGVADNMLITTYLSMKAPVFVAPAMDLDMYAHPSTQRNLDTLRQWGNIIIEPREGFLASQLIGKGRMEEPVKIVQTIARELSRTTSPLSGKKVLITAGPTYEKIDPVRFIGNYSSGKMGYALAEACALQGASVTLVSGPVHLDINVTGVERINVENAKEMYEATIKRFADTDIAILCAAVADFRPTTLSDTKIKREKDLLHLSLEPTQDIAASLGKMKKENQRIIGFALETDDEEHNALDKLKRKNLDLIVLNSLKNEGAGFMVDTNQVTILSSHSRTSFPCKPKQEVAEDIIAALCDIL